MCEERGSDELLYDNPKVTEARVSESLLIEQNKDAEEERRLDSFRLADPPTDEPGVTHTSIDRAPPVVEKHPEFEELPEL